MKLGQILYVLSFAEFLRNTSQDILEGGFHQAVGFLLMIHLFSDF